MRRKFYEIVKGLSIPRSYSVLTMKITPGKKFWCHCDTFEILVNFEILRIFEILNGHFDQMAKNIGNFVFVIFNQDNVLFILVEFESDQMSPRESPKNGRIGDYGLNCIFLSLSSYLKSTMKITLEKQISRLYHTFEIFVI